MAKQQSGGKTLKEALAVNLKERRLALNLSQEALADACGLHRTYIGSVERAERNVTLATLETLAAALGVSVPKLLTRNPRSVILERTLTRGTNGDCRALRPSRAAAKTKNDS